MTTTAECTLQVGIADLQHAVTAVIGHADKPKLGDDALTLSRIRLSAGRDELLVLATNGRTTAQAAVGIDEDSRDQRFAADDGSFEVDLHPKMLRQLVAGLTAVKVDGDLEGVAELHFTNQTVTATDVSGLWPMSKTERPVLARSDEFPDLMTLHREALANASGTYKPLVTGDRTASLFDAAGKAYSAEIIVEPVGSAESRGFVVLVGDAFVGTLSSRHGDGDSLSRRDKLRRRHMERHGLALKAVG